MARSAPRLRALFLTAALLAPALARADLLGSDHTLRAQAAQPGLALTVLALTARYSAYGAAESAGASVPQALDTRFHLDADLEQKRQDVQDRLTAFLVRDGAPEESLPAPLPGLRQARASLTQAIPCLSKLIKQDPLPSDPAAADACHKTAIDALVAGDRAATGFEYARRAAAPELSALAELADARYAQAVKANAKPAVLAALLAQANELHRLGYAVDGALANAVAAADLTDEASAALISDSTARAFAAVVRTTNGAVEDVSAAAAKNIDSPLLPVLNTTSRDLTQADKDWSTISGDYVPTHDDVGGAVGAAQTRHTAGSMAMSSRDTIAALAALNRVAGLSK